MARVVDVGAREGFGTWRVHTRTVWSIAPRFSTRGDGDRVLGFEGIGRECRSGRKQDDEAQCVYASETYPEPTRSAVAVLAGQLDHSARGLEGGQPVVSAVGGY